jgi:hypothetical protein
LGSAVILQEPGQANVEGGVQAGGDGPPESRPDRRAGCPRLFALDLTLIVPAFLIGAVLRWCGHPAGAVAGVAMNVLGVLYMAARAFAGGFQAHAGISEVVGRPAVDRAGHHQPRRMLAAAASPHRKRRPGCRPTRSGRPAGMTCNR